MLLQFWQAVISALLRHKHDLKLPVKSWGATSRVSPQDAQNLLQSELMFPVVLNVYPQAVIVDCTSHSWNA
jgi:hypothetical protein